MKRAKRRPLPTIRYVELWEFSRSCRLMTDSLMQLRGDLRSVAEALLDLRETVARTPSRLSYAVAQAAIAVARAR